MWNDPEVKQEDWAEYIKTDEAEKKVIWFPQVWNQLSNLTDLMNIETDGDGNITSITVPDSIRVKHLDQEDIEECGWNQVEYDTYKFKDFYLEFNNEYRTFIYEKKSGQENTVFKGIINNKSELKKLMQQLLITQGS